jgi:hypothetical protein
MSSRDLANLKNGLVAAWIPSLGSTGYRLVDRVGSNHGVLTNMDAGSDWVVSGGNLSLDFDGTNDFVDNNPWTTNLGTGDFSLSAWIKTSSATRQTIFGAYNGSVVDSGVFLDVLSTGKIRVTAVQASATRLIFADSNSSAATGSWTHVCGVRRGATMDVYVNGKIDNGVQSSLGNPNVAITGSHRIGSGRSDAGYSSPFNGQIDDARVYSRALSATEVSLLSKERGIGFKTSSRTSSVFAKRYAYKPPKDKTYAAITRSQSDYDSLREGLVLAICPSVSGATGYRAVDVSGRGNHGTLNGMTPEDWVPSGGALSLDFDGSNDNVSLPSTTSIPSTMTFAAWVYRTADWAFNGNCLFWAKPNATFNGNGFYIEPNATGYSNTTLVVTNNFNNFLQLNQNGNTSFPLNTWTHFAFWINGNNGQFYLNGVPVSTTVIGTLGITNTADAKYIFSNSPGYGTYTPGRIDDLRIYNRALSEPEIRQLASRRGIGLQSTPRHTDYLETREKTYSVIVKSQQEHSSLSEGLVGAWCPSLGATGYRLVDRSGYGNHGTLTNMTSDDWVVSGGAGALDFDGSNDYVARAISLVGDFSVSLWFSKRTNGTAGSERVVFGASGSLGIPYIADIAPTFASLHSNTSGQFGSFAFSFNLNTWYHLIFTRQSNSVQAFVNGRQSSSGAKTVTGDFSIAYIGRYQDTGNVYDWDGQLDDIRIYNRALTEPEIRLLASRRGIGLQPRPKQFTYYQFPSGSKRRRLLTGMP